MKVEYVTFGEPEIMGIKLIPENDTDKRITDRFFNGGARAHSFNGTELTITFSDLVTMSEMEKELEEMKRTTRIPLPGSEESKKTDSLDKAQELLLKLGLMSPRMTCIPESPAHAKMMEEIRAGAGIVAKKKEPKSMAAAAEQFFTENPLAKGLTIRDVMDRLDPQGAPHKVIRGDKKQLALYSSVWSGLNRAVKRKVATVKRRKVGNSSFRVYSGVGSTTTPKRSEHSVFPARFVAACVEVLKANPGESFSSARLYRTVIDYNTGVAEECTPEQAGKLTTCLKEFIARTKMKGLKFKMAQHKVVFCYEPPAKPRVALPCQAGDVPSW